MDKNGRLSTKHVRVVPPTSSEAANVPAPTIRSGTAMKPVSHILTVSQTEPKSRAFDIDPFDRSVVDLELLEKVRTEDIRGRSYFKASDEEIYSVFSVANESNALLLLEDSVRSAEEAKRYLEASGMSRLIEDNDSMCKEALGRGIRPESFVEAIAALGPPAGSNHYMDAVEAHSMTFLDKMNVHHDVYQGNISLVHLKDIGPDRLSNWRLLVPIRQSLQEINDGTAVYTIDHLKKLMDEHNKVNAQYKVALVINIANEYGIDFAMTLQNTNWGYAEFLLDTGVEKERAKALLKYEDDIASYASDHAIYSEGLSYVKCAKYFDAGISVADAAEGGISDQQLDGIKGGIERSISGGWL